MAPGPRALLILAAAALAAGTAWPGDESEEWSLDALEPAPFRIGGNVKTLLLGYDLSDPTLNAYRREAALVTSFRLTAAGDPSGRFGYEVHLVLRDDRVTDPVAGSSGTTTEAVNPLFRGLGDGSQWVETDRHTLHADVGYANVRWSPGKTDIVAGRQAVTFGRSFFWNPIDWLASFSPTEIDREYKTGVDAVRITRSIGAFSGAEFVYAYGEGGRRDQSAAIGRVYGTVQGWDLELLAGSVLADDRYGLAWSGDVRGAGVRGEISLHRPSSGPDPDFTRATLEVDYRWENSVQFIAEWHYNGFGTTDSTNYAALLQHPRVATGQIRNVGRDYLASSLGYEFSPLVNGTLAVLGNLHDGSGIVSPTLSISLGDESRLAAGAILPWGDRPVPAAMPSEYGAYPTILWVQYRLYF